MIPNFKDLTPEEVSQRTKEIENRIRSGKLQGTAAKIQSLPAGPRQRMMALYNQKMGPGGVAPSVAARKQARKAAEKAKPVIKSKDILLSSENVGPTRTAIQKTPKKGGPTYRVKFPSTGLRQKIKGAESFKDLASQELTQGMSNIYSRLGYDKFIGIHGGDEKNTFNAAMQQSNLPQTLGNVFDGATKKLLRKTIRDYSKVEGDTGWDVPNAGAPPIPSIFKTKGQRKGDLKLTVGGGKSDFADKILRDRGLKHEGHVPNFASFTRDKNEFKVKASFGEVANWFPTAKTFYDDYPSTKTGSKGRKLKYGRLEPSDQFSHKVTVKGFDTELGAKAGKMKGATSGKGSGKRYDAAEANRLEQVAAMETGGHQTGVPEAAELLGPGRHMKKGAESQGFPVDIIYDSLSPWAAGEAKNYKNFMTPVKGPTGTFPDPTNIDNFYKATIGKHVRYALHYPEKDIGKVADQQLQESSSPHAAKIDKIDLGNYLLAVSNKTKIPESSRMTDKFTKGARKGQKKFKQVTLNELENSAKGFIPNFAKRTKKKFAGVYDWDDTVVNYPKPYRGMPPIDTGVLSKIGLGLQSSRERFDVLTARSEQYIPDIKKYARERKLNVKKIQAVGDAKWKPGQRAADKGKALEKYPKGTKFADDDPENVKTGFLAGMDVQQVGDPYGPSWKREGKWRKESRGYADGFIPNFATGIYDSDKIAGKGKQQILNAILSSGKKTDVVWGPAGSGKSTFTSAQYPDGSLIKQLSDVDRFSNFVVDYAGGFKPGKSSRGLKPEMTAPGQKLFGAAAASGGRIKALAPPREKLMKQRQGRIDKIKSKGLPDQRSKTQLEGTRWAPGVKYGDIAHLRKKYGNIDLIRSEGFVPNFAKEFDDLTPSEFEKLQTAFLKTIGQGDQIEGNDRADQKRTGN